MQTIDTHVLNDVISLKTTKGIEFIYPAEILYFGIENRDVKIFLMDGNAGITLHSLKELEIILESFHFFRCHAKHLINLTHIKRYTHKTGEVELLHSKTAKVAFDRKIKFKQLICRILPTPPPCKPGGKGKSNES